MQLSVTILSLALFVTQIPARAQYRVSPHNMHERVIAVVPLVGAGTYADPVRPMYAPANGQDSKDEKGIRSYSWQMADDGKSAIVEFVAGKKEAFKALLADKKVKAFEKGKATKEEIESGLKPFKRDFNLDGFASKEKGTREEMGK